MSDNPLDQITKDLGTRYDVSKTAVSELAEKKSEFYTAIDAEIASTETLAQKTITVPTEITNDEEAIEKYIKTFHPGWRLSAKDITPGNPIIGIEEDPGYRKYVHINVEDGRLYRRNVSQEGPSLDDARLQEEDPALWKRITRPARVLKDFNKVSNKDLAAMQAYFVPGKMTIKLDTPRKAKPEELGDI